MNNRVHLARFTQNSHNCEARTTFGGFGLQWSHYPGNIVASEIVLLLSRLSSQPTGVILHEEFLISFSELARGTISWLKILLEDT